MLTHEALMQYIKDYIKACNQLGVTFSKVILFGSYARNQAHQWSDIDLALISDNFTTDRIDNRDKIVGADIKFSNIEPHTFNTKYFEDGDPFTEEIKKTGIEILVED
jgi:predicted nucleotidyltransferase